jgi:hypothetical protein
MGQRPASNVSRVLEKSSKRKSYRSTIQSSRSSKTCKRFAAFPNVSCNNINLVAANAKVLSLRPSSTWYTCKKMLMMPALQNDPLAERSLARKLHQLQLHVLKCRQYQAAPQKLPTVIAFSVLCLCLGPATVVAPHINSGLVPSML